MTNLFKIVGKLCPNALCRSIILEIIRKICLHHSSQDLTSGNWLCVLVSGWADALCLLLLLVILTLACLLILTLAAAHLLPERLLMLLLVVDMLWRGSLNEGNWYQRHGKGENKFLPAAEPCSQACCPDHAPWTDWLNENVSFSRFHIWLKSWDWRTVDTNDQAIERMLNETTTPLRTATCLMSASNCSLLIYQANNNSTTTTTTTNMSSEEQRQWDPLAW